MTLDRPMSALALGATALSLYLSGPASASQPRLPVATAQDLKPTGTPAPGPRASNRFAVSKVLGKKDRKMVGGETACYIDFVYAGEEPQQMVWDEPCSATGAGMIGRPRMEELGWWEKLDSFARQFVEAMPGGKVLYIEGSFTAFIFPRGTTGSPYEVTVAD